MSKSDEAIKRLESGEKFDAVAREMSEDKAKAGQSLHLISLYCIYSMDVLTQTVDRRIARLEDQGESGSQV